MVDKPMNAPSRSKTVWMLLQNQLQQALPGFMKARRWFGGKTRTIRSVEIADVIPIPNPAVAAAILVSRVNYLQGPGDTYTVPLLEEAPGGAQLANDDNTRIRVRDADGTEHIFSDALSNQAVLETFFDAIRDARRFSGAVGELVGVPEHSLERLRIAAEGKLQPSLMKAEQSNSSVLYGRAFVLKVFRHLEMGVNPDLELGRFLSEKAAFRNIPPVAGAFEYRSGKGEPATMAILQGFVANRGDAWEHTLAALSIYYDRVAGENLPEPNAKSRNSAAALLGDYAAEAALLGRRTAEMHGALASDRGDPAFAPEAFSPGLQRDISDSMIGLARESFGMLRRRAPDFRGDFRKQVDATLDLEAKLTERFQSLANRKLTGWRTRIHGDLHLGQVLFTGQDFMFIDFEGEPARTLAERREKHSPLRDVAGMVRSFHYAAYAALFRRDGGAGAQSDESRSLVQFANAWYRAASGEYLRAYFEAAAASGADFLPDDPDEREFVLNLWLLGKAIYELKYELNHRLDWVAIPLEGIDMLLRGPAAS
jgi:maltose alpha-D-glucosyltransferase / alpha-amylase